MEKRVKVKISEWGVTPLPLRLMGSMTHLRKGGCHTPK